ncbi:uncharacterized protein LOC120175887 [Hibiscus syriacus]|uniref:uncharacterized protein LOC120175887 n=1 Tax=Hibiscus syriacus TaxID=106335 RepID=UPI001921C816|nr:uncharacterized protein LOC120175887 [Hibiscus syriacus]
MLNHRISLSLAVANSFRLQIDLAFLVLKNRLRLLLSRCYYREMASGVTAFPLKLRPSWRFLTLLLVLCCCWWFSLLQPVSVKILFGNREILIETGHIGRQASGSVMATDGETIVYTSVCLSDVPSEPSDFFPLSVTYQERFSAVGRTRGGFFK